MSNGVPAIQDSTLLSPLTNKANGAPQKWNWRDWSRSPSPLGLIPIHKEFRAFIHKHEVPRKVLHTSIGFFTLWFYVSGMQTSAIPPYLMGGLIPIATTDYLRFKFPSLNRLYVKLLGALMRESEYESWNGVIWYLLGTWTVLYWLPKDVSVMAVLLLSWCDTAASTFGRMWGRYTPRIRPGKSVAGTSAAFLVGVGTAAAFWGWLAPRTGPFPGDELWPFMFKGVLRLPSVVSNALDLSAAQSTISGGAALAVMSVWTGFVAAASEVVDIFGWDDNLTIPVLSGIGIWGFLKVFG
jgi:diacylglycerol kinase (CTP)